jgi:DNA polymerase (family X)
MDKSGIIDLLSSLARLLELKGENSFKIRAYGNAIRTLETTPLSQEQLRDPEHLITLDGIGQALADKIAEIATTGSSKLYEKIRAEFPATLFELFDLQGLGAKKIKVLHDELGIASIPDLAAACEDGRVAALPGFGAKSAANFLKAIAQLAQHAGRHRYGDVAALVEQLLNDLRELPEVSLAQVAGSFRRRKEEVGDLDLLVQTKSPEPVGAYFVAHPLVRDILAHGPTKCSVLLQNGLQCDLRLVNSTEFPFALNYFTGSKEHNIQMRARALERGWSLNEYRFSPADGRTLLQPIPPVHDETELYRALDLDFIPPELRENLGEIPAAATGQLPSLLELSNLRGTFHNHTTASDGSNTLEEMAHAAEELGLAYLGIADHSKSSFQANGLDADRLLAQIAAIRQWNATQPGIHLFAGTECDILKDGSLDFPDEILAQCDYVVASIHSSFQLDEATMTRRIIRAMENPHVTLLAHPTGRLLLDREPYAVDIPAILEAAAATGTWIELNANPWRLDLDWRWWPLAKEIGVRCVINPDAHSTDGLRDLFFGVGIARKGWLTRRDVVNCLPLSEIQTALAAKRTRRAV